MSTTRTLDFKVEAIRANIHATHAAAVKAAEDERAAVLPHDEAMDAWRKEQIRRVRSLASRFAKGTVSDDELAWFSTDLQPHRRDEKQADEKLAGRVKRAYDTRDRALTRLDAIRSHVPVGETEAVVSLTPAAARDWFGI